MIAQTSAKRRRGEPLLALALLLSGWTGARMLLWHTPFGSPFAALAATSAKPGREVTARFIRERSRHTIARLSVRRTHAPARFIQSPRERVHIAPPQANLGSTGEPRTRGLWEPRTALSSPVFAVPEAEGFVVQTDMAHPKKSGRRWHLAGWAAWRSGSGVPRRADGPRPVSYGGSQAGAVARFDLAGGGHRPALHVRATYAPDRFSQTDIAVGAGLRPVNGLPIRLMGEVRATRTQGRTEIRPALLAVTELSPVSLPLRVTAEGYGQAGWVGGRYSTPFVDGQARLTRQVLSSARAQINVGAGAWGGAQKFAGRLDVGPTIGVDIDGGSVLARVSLDYRIRVSGEATPGDGLTLTLSTGF